MPTNEQLAFWAVIRANPLDDTPRLVYADWLEENGDAEHGEFIRVQCALALLGKDRRKAKKERPALERKQKTLLTRHGKIWQEPFRKVLAGTDSDDEWLPEQVFVRGFIDLRYIPLASAARVATAGDDLEPVNQMSVSEMGVNYNAAQVAAIGAWSGAGCVVDFSIARAGDCDVTAIVEPGNMTNVARLCLWDGKVSDAGAMQLAKWPHAVKLRHLDLQGSLITDAGALSFAESPYLGDLTRFHLYNARIGAKGKKCLRDRFGDRITLD